VSYTVTTSSLLRMLGRWKREGPAYVSLANSFRNLIMDGRLPSGSRLPSERLLAPQLRVSRNTVSAAYRLLRESGHLRSQRGAGSYVELPAAYRQADRVVSWAPAAEGEPVIDFTVASPPPPTEFLHRATRAIGRDLGGRSEDTGYDLKGLPELREAIAGRYAAAGLPTDPDEIMVTAGAQHAWALLVRLLTRARDRVLLDSPTYPSAIDTVRSLDRQMFSVGLAEDGWDAYLLASVIRRERPALAYFMSGFHNPTGLRLPGAAQHHVADAAEDAGTYVVFDETLADLSLLPGPAPSDLFRERSAHVVLIGSLSKICWAGMRLGWLRAPASLVSRLVDMRAAADVGNPVLTQLVALEVFGSYDELVAERRAMIAADRDALVAALRELAPGWTFRPPDGGLSLWVDLGARVSSPLALAAAERNVLVLPGPRFGQDGTLEDHVRLPYLYDRAVARDGVSRLMQAFAEVTEARNAVATER
jgi:DNA-binding transcriptional MocR family regulator